MVGKELCTGCGACGAVCSEKAVAMRPDREGFLYPELDPARCTGCGACGAVCPVSRRERRGGERSCFGCAGSIGNIIAFQAINAALIGKQKQMAVSRHGNHMFHVVFIIQCQ